MTKVCTACGQGKPLNDFACYRKRGRVCRRARCRECVRRIDREQHQQRKAYAPWWEKRRKQIADWNRRQLADPEGYERRRAQWNAYNRRRTARQTVPTRAAPERVVPSGPFVAWLEQHVDDFASLDCMADALGISDTTLRKQLNGTYVRVSEDLVDRALQMYEGWERLDDLYPAEAVVA